MSAISLSMSEDMHTPPLPHNKHNSSSSMNTVRKKDSVFTTSAGRISNLINQNSDLNSGQSPYPTLNEDSPEPEPMTKSEADREDEEKNNDKLKKRDTSSPRRYSKRASEFKNGHNGNNGLLENGLPQPINPMIQHRQSIKKKVTINPTDIFGNKNITSKSSKSNQNGHRQSQLNNHTHYHLMNDQTKKRNSIKHQHKGGAPVTRSASAPRTSQQFNPQSLKKRQSQQFQQALPTIMMQIILLRVMDIMIILCHIHKEEELHHKQEINIIRIIKHIHIQNQQMRARKLIPIRTQLMVIVSLAMLRKMEIV
eukprot:CAMPEP_0201578138 /NCGR_PEP_ID=MMETSP0190_2-20130828/24871_1 /ASSEMBLY_ACC=CAM_ASM_000263 /TAXON_ID=37353 /ORGANISM="Rosalina sp." /LENGTH=309 /DNA_ID=CAMNT_0048010991 /DNA_START=1505 /DNA_END=2435 /DNA_ORIENTATION=+